MLVDFTHEIIWFGFLLVEGFQITDSISLLVTGLVIFSISSWFSFGRVCISKNLSLSKLYVFLAYSLLTAICYDPLYSCGISWNFFFDSDFPDISSVQLLRCVWLFATPWTAARQAFLSITSSQSLLKLISIESVMPSSHLILYCPLLLLPPIPTSIRVFISESTLRMM